MLKRAGFTLLELMIAMALLSVIMLLTAGAVRLGYRSIESGERKMDVLERRRSFLFLISAQVESYVPLTYYNNGVVTPYFQGRRDSLTFASNYSLWGGERGFVVVTYRVGAGVGGRSALYAAEHTVGMENRMETKVIDGFDEIYFEYARKGAAEQAATWVDAASADPNAPERIRVSLAKGAMRSSFIVPVRVTGSPAKIPAFAAGGVGGTSQ